MKKHKLDSRHEARRVLVQALFAYSFFKNTEPLSHFVGQFLKEYPPLVYDENLLEGIQDQIIDVLPQIDPLIAKAAPEWPLDKIAKIDLAILRLAVYEMAIAKSVPYKVAIDEAVELAKEFGGEASAKFVNGALGTIVKRQGLSKN